MGLFSSQLSIKTLVPLCRQLATAYDAGIPVVQTLELTATTQTNPRVKEMLRAMQQRIRDGESLGDAARSQSRLLPPMLLALLAAGEKGGRLDEMLRDLAAYYEDRLEMRRRVLSVLALPLMELTAAWFLGTFALGIVSNLSFDSTTRFSLSSYLNHYLLFQAGALGVAGLALLAGVALARGGLIGMAWGRIAYTMWPFSTLTRKFALARFFRTFSLLLSSGLPVRRCVEESAAACGNPYIEQELLRALPPIMNGESLKNAFAATGMLSSTAREMLAIGEESGKLDTSLYKAAQYHLNDASHALEMAGKVGRVAIVLLVGLIVGYIVISFYGNYYGNILNQIR